LRVAETLFFLCDSNVVECAKTLSFYIRSLKLAQDLVSMLVEQIAHMKIGACPYFQLLPISRPHAPSKSIKIMNVEPCLVCDERFYVNDICTASCGHTYHPWCLCMHVISSKNVLDPFFNVYYNLT
jgi:hypothetical protein